MNEPIDPIGAGLPRLESREKLTGRAQYTDDLHRPGMLHGAILGCPHAHARILSYDIGEALALPGVKAVITGDDFEWNYSGPFIKDETVLAKGKVRYVGEPVAAVAAVDPETARQATRLIEIEYEELPAVLSIDAAIAEEAPEIHPDLDKYFKIFQSEQPKNTLVVVEIHEGDPETAWAECDAIVEGEYETQAQAHVCLEPSTALAEMDGGGRVTLWSSNQSVFRVQANVCEQLGIPMSKLRSVTPMVGGAFGAKMEICVQSITVALAMKTDKPVKITLSREQDFEIIRARHPARVRMKTGARKDGTLVARSYECILDCGAYADDSPGVAGICALFGRGPYRIPNVRGIARGVYTNKLRSGAFRGFGGPQVQFAGEQQIDQLAEMLGLDPIEMRIKNAVCSGDDYIAGQKVTSSGLVECLERVRDACDWKSRGTRPATPGKKRGIGIACLPHISGVLASGAIVRMLEDGTVVLNTGAVDNGQGSDTVLAQICAAALKIPVENVVFATPDTDAGVYNWGTTASRVTYTAGRAVVAAAGEVEKQLKEHASEILECAAEDLELRPGGMVAITGVPGKEVTFGAISARAHWAVGGPIVGSHTFVYTDEGFDPKRAFIAGFPFGKIGAWIFAAQAVEVEVDEDTGVVTPLRVWSAHDVGRAINPTAVEGQIQGGVVQGLGYALIEELVWDSGRLANPSLMDYKVPGTLDVPVEIEAIIVEAPDATGPFGAKGIGEPPIVGIAAAVSNAICDATGVRLNQLPMTPERVLSAIEADRKGAD